MKNITEYTDYSLLLKHFYEETKRRNPHFSYQVFSRHAGISSRGFLYNVVAGKRRLSPSHVPGVAKAMKLTKSQCDYFENLVSYTNARSLADKRKYFEKMNALHLPPDGVSEPFLMRKEHYRYYSQWFHAAVRSVIDLRKFSGDYEQLGRMLRPPISTAQAKRSVALLESLGLVLREDGGTWRVADRIVTTPPEVASIAIHNYHLQMIDMAKSALNCLPRDKRNFSGVTLGISTAAYPTLCREIELFRTRLMELAASDNQKSGTQGVYHLNLQLFPISVSIEPEAEMQQ